LINEKFSQSTHLIYYKFNLSISLTTPPGRVVLGPPARMSSRTTPSHGLAICEIGAVSCCWWDVAAFGSTVSIAGLSARPVGTQLDDSIRTYSGIACRVVIGWTWRSEMSAVSTVMASGRRYDIVRSAGQRFVNRCLSSLSLAMLLQLQSDRLANTQTSVTYWFGCIGRVMYELPWPLSSFVWLTPQRCEKINAATLSAIPRNENDVFRRRSVMYQGVTHQPDSKLAILVAVGVQRFWYMSLPCLLCRFFVSGNIRPISSWACYLVDATA